MGVYGACWYFILTARSLRTVLKNRSKVARAGRLVWSEDKCCCRDLEREFSGRPTKCSASNQQ